MKKIFILILLVILFSCQKTTLKLTLTPKMSDDSQLVPTREQFQADIVANARGGKPGKPDKPGKPPTPTPEPPSPPPSTGTKIIYVNFDGAWIGQDGRNNDWAYQVGDGSGFYALPSNLTEAQKDSVMDDPILSFSEYNVVVTRDSNVYKAATGWKQETVVTPTKFASGSGVSFIGSGAFSWHPVNFVFEESLFSYALYVGKIVTHEQGHAAELHHQSTYNPDCTLYSRYTDGAKMGAHWSTIGLWITGPSTCCTCIQPDKTILTNVLQLK